MRPPASATGIGDIVVRAKYNFLRARGGGLAAAVDVRTPTGDESNLLGTGGVQTKVYGIASIGDRQVVAACQRRVHRSRRKGALSDAALNDEWNYAVGLRPRRVAAAHADRGRPRSIDPRVGRLREADKVFEFVQAGPGGGAVAAGRRRWRRRRGRRRDDSDADGQVTRREFRFEPGNLNLATGNVGVRFSPLRTLLVSASLLFNLTDAGLRDRVTPVISVDYAF